MPEIRGTLPRVAGPSVGPCVWCSEATDTLAETPGRPDLGNVPLHVWCAGEVILAYRRLGEGKLLTEGAARLAGFEARLNALDLYREARLPVPAAPEVHPINATELEIRFAIAFLDETVPTWRDQVAAWQGREERKATLDPKRAAMRSRLEAFGAYRVVPHDDGCVGVATGDMKLCRCVPPASERLDA